MNDLRKNEAPLPSWAIANSPESNNSTGRMNPAQGSIKSLFVDARFHILSLDRTLILMPLHSAPKSGVVRVIFFIGTPPIANRNVVRRGRAK